MPPQGTRDVGHPIALLSLAQESSMESNSSVAVRTSIMPHHHWTQRKIGYELNRDCLCLEL